VLVVQILTNLGIAVWKRIAVLNGSVDSSTVLDI